MLRTISRRLALGLFAGVPPGAWWWVILLLGAYGLVAVPFGAATGILHPRMTSASLPRFLAFGLVVFVVPCLAEELLFRVVLLPHPSENMPAGRRALVVAAGLGAFVLWHPLNAWLLLPAARPLFWDGRFLALAGLLGAGCAALYQRSGSIWPGTVFHWAIVVGWKGMLGGSGYGIAQIGP